MACFLRQLVSLPFSNPPLAEVEVIAMGITNCSANYVENMGILCIDASTGSMFISLVSLILRTPRIILPLFICLLLNGMILLKWSLLLITLNLFPFFQSPFPNVAPYISAIYPYMYHTPHHVAYNPPSNVSPAGSYAFPHIF